MVGLVEDDPATFLIATRDHDEVPTAWLLAQHDTWLRGGGLGSGLAKYSHPSGPDRLCLHRDEYVQLDGVVRLLETFIVEAALGEGHLLAKVGRANRDCLASGAGSFWDSGTGIRARYLSAIEDYDNSDVRV